MKPNPFKLARTVSFSEMMRARRLEDLALRGGTIGTQAEDTVRHLGIAATLQVGLKRRHSPGGIKRGH